MGKYKLHLLLLVLFIQFESVAQTENFRFQQLLKTAPTASTAFAIKNESVVLERLLTCKEVKVKQIGFTFKQLHNGLVKRKNPALLPNFTMNLLPQLL